MWLAKAPGIVGDQIGTAQVASVAPHGLQQRLWPRRAGMVLKVRPVAIGGAYELAWRPRWWAA